MIKDILRGALAGRKGCYGLILSFLVAVFLVQSPLQASEPKTKCKVEYVKDKMTINAENVALGQILDTIREKAGIEFSIGGELSKRSLTVQLGPLPLTKMMERILSNFSYIFFVGPDDNLIKVYILVNADFGGRLPSIESVDNSVERPRAQVHQHASFIYSAEEGMVIEPSTRERVAFPSFPETEMVLNPPPPMVNDMIVTSATKRMVIEPPIEKSMVVIPATVPMHIEYHSGVNMPVKINPGGANFPTPE